MPGCGGPDFCPHCAHNNKNSNAHSECPLNYSSDEREEVSDASQNDSGSESTAAGGVTDEAGGGKYPVFKMPPTPQRAPPRRRKRRMAQRREETEDPSCTFGADYAENPLRYAQAAVKNSVVLDDVVLPHAATEVSFWKLLKDVPIGVADERATWLKNTLRLLRYSMNRKDWEHAETEFEKKTLETCSYFDEE